MNAAVVKRTQEALGKVIRRPPLTEKLLNKPPFRYLHDIITEVIRVTGFLKGLYTDAEMKSENVKEKDAKISFLQKAIDVVVMVTGEPLSAKPARIVAGHEPERTNELLQRIGRCCLHKLSSDDAVKRVLAGEKGDVKGRTSATVKPQEPDNRNARDEGPRAPREREDRRNSEKHERSTSGERKQKEDLKEESKPRDKNRDQEKTRENDRDRHRDPERDRTKARARQDRDRDRDRDRGNRERGRDLEREKERKHEGSKEKERERDKGRDRDRDRRKAKSGEHPRDPDREKSREREKPEKKSSLGEISKKLSDGSLKDSKAETEAEVSTRASRAVTTKTAKRRSKASLEEVKEMRQECNVELFRWEDSVEGDSPSDAEGEVGPVSQDQVEASESPVAPRQPPPSVRAPRPGSARPAPPRAKRQDSVEVLAADRTGRGDAVPHVIADSQNSDSDDDGQFVVEAAPPPSEVAGLEVAQAVELEEDEKHGGLVKKILETKKDYEKLQLSPKPGEKETPLVFESAWKKEKDIVAKEIEKLRASIQTLCRSALPLGKVMDYLQEDVDAMQHELRLWQSERQQHSDALRAEQSITDGAVEPLRAELAELEQQIRDQQDKICAVKANILRNEEKMQRMVHSVTLSARR